MSAVRDTVRPTTKSVPSPVVANKPGCGNSLLAMAVSAALCATPPAHAQQAKDDLTLEEIVVTATRRQINLQDVAQSISVLSTKDIETAGYREMGDYIKALPSVTLAQSQPGRNTVVFRGISNGTDQFRTDSQAALYFDEQPLTTNSQQVSPYLVDIERIEALPGPQGTLFGSAAQAGTLRIIANKPDPSGFSGQYSLNSFATKGGAGSFEADGHLNIPLIADVLTARIVLFGADDGGWVDNVAGPDLATAYCAGKSDLYCTSPYPGRYSTAQPNFNEWKVAGGRVAALWTISDRTDVLFNVMRQKEQTKGDWLSDPALGDNKITRFFDESRNDDWWQAAATLTMNLGFAELKSASAYFHRHITYESDNTTYEQAKSMRFGTYDGSYTYYPAGMPKASIYDSRLLSDGSFTASTLFNDQHQERVSQEIRLTSTGASKLQWIGGLFYERVHDDWFYGTHNPELMNTYAWQAANDQACGSGISCLPPSNLGYTELVDRVARQNAVFGELSYKLTDRWSVTGGARWFKYHRESQEAFDFPQGLPAGSHAASGDDSGKLFKLGTQYKYNSDGMLYLLFSQGYRLGGSNSVRAANTGLIPLHYKPDQLNNYEAGIKSQWFDKRLTLNASAFLMRWKDMQLENGGLGAWWVRGNSNGGTAETRGLEFSGALRATQRLSFDFSLIAADPKLTEDTVYANGEVIPSGTTLVGAPKLKGAAGVNYKFAWRPFGGELSARFDYSYQSSEYQDIYKARAHGADGEIPAWNYGKFQLALAMPSSLELTLTLDNVWDEKGLSWINGDGGNADAFGDQRFHALRTQFRPQNIGLRIRRKF